MVAFVLPNRASAFALPSWSFFSNASAATTAILGPRPQVLAAATNYNPNPYKGLGDSQTISDNALVAQEGPGGTIADIETSVTSDRISVYVVRPGDTLSEIAVMFDVSVNTIVWANNLKGVNDVHTGDILVILPVSGISHTIVKGDTLRSLANKFSADADEIAQFNGLDSSAPLEVGSTIIIPNGEITAPTPVPSAKKTRAGSEPYLGGSGPAQPGYYSSPVPGSRVTQGLHGHNAIDFGAARGTPIHAAADGITIIARNGGWNGGYGNYVVITHGNGTQTLYAHMTNAIVSPGQSVSSGQVVGYVGSTGKSTGAHLHFEVRGAANPFAR